MTDQNYIKRTSEASSPVFTYSKGTTVTIEYMIRQSSNDVLYIILEAGKENVQTQLWESSGFALYGVFQSCVYLQDEYSMKNVSLKLGITYSDIKWKDKINIYTAFRSLTLNQADCPGIQDSFAHEFTEIFLTCETNNIFLNTVELQWLELL